MDDLRVGPAGPLDWHSGRAKDQAKKRRLMQSETPDEPVDRVTLSSGETEDPATTYLPRSSDEEHQTD